MSDADAVSARGARFVTAAAAAIGVEIGNDPCGPATTPANDGAAISSARAIGNVLIAVVDAGNGPLVWGNDGADPDRGEGWRITSGRSDAPVTGRVAGTGDPLAMESEVELDVKSDVTSEAASGIGSDLMSRITADLTPGGDPSASASATVPMASWLDPGKATGGRGTASDAEARERAGASWGTCMARFGTTAAFWEAAGGRV